MTELLQHLIDMMILGSTYALLGIGLDQATKALVVATLEGWPIAASARRQATFSRTFAILSAFPSSGADEAAYPPISR